MKRVILIDPEAKTITEEIIGDDLQSYYNLLGCRLIEGFYPQELGITDHFLYGDEEGTFKHPHHYFFVYGADFPTITGKACVVKLLDEGVTGSCTLTIEQVKELVEFI